MFSLNSTVETAENQTQKIGRSSSTTSNNDSSLEDLSKDMFKTAGDYIKGEIDICVADYNTLERMNKLVIDKYKNLSNLGVNVSNEMTKLNEAYATLVPLLEQIDDVEKCVGELELSANKLDAYTKRLETKYKQFHEKYLSK